MNSLVSKAKAVQMNVQGGSILRKKLILLLSFFLVTSVVETATMPFSELPTASIIVVVFFSFLVTILELHAVVKSKVTWMRWIALFAKIGAVFNVLGMGFLLVFLGVVATVPREKRCGDVEDCPYDAIELLNGIWTLFNSAVYLYYAVCAVRFYTELKEDTAITGVYPIYLPVGSDEV